MNEEIEKRRKMEEEQHNAFVMLAIDWLQMPENKDAYEYAAKRMNDKTKNYSYRRATAFFLKENFLVPDEINQSHLWTAIRKIFPHNH
jgi:hypothetical protein